MVESLTFGTSLPRLACFLKNSVAGFAWMAAACQMTASVTFEAEGRDSAELEMEALQCWCFRERAGPVGNFPKGFERYEATRESLSTDPEVLQEWNRKG